MGTTERIRELAAPVLVAAGLELWDVECSRDVVRILVDRPGGGVDLDALSTASRAVSPLFDDHPGLAPAAPYQLEVSSPGVERTLRTPDHFRRYLGSPITVKTAVPVAGARRHHGTLRAVGPDGVTLADGDGGTAVEISFDQIDRARTVMEWALSGPARTGHRTAPGAARTAPELKDAAS